MFIASIEEIEKLQRYCYKICLSNKYKIMSNDISVESHLSNVIRRDMNTVYVHIDRHVTAQGEILKLDSDCEYCKIYLLEQEIN
jgi:hypothetical protein